MSDVETELRELLQERAEEVRIDDRIPQRVLRRARRRRVASAVVAGAVAAGLIGGAVVGIRAALPERPVGFADPTQTSVWRGIWPQGTREEAEAAQAAADAQDAEAVWQVDAGEVLEQFAFQHLGWDRVFWEEELPEVDRPGGPLTVNIGDCNTVGPERCPHEADVTIERLLRNDATGIWLVTAVDETESATPVSRAEVRRFIEEFMETRNLRSQSLVHDVVSRAAMDQYEAGDKGLALWGPVDDPAFQGFDYSIDSIEPVDGDRYEVTVRLSERYDDDRGVFAVGQERLFVGPGENLRGERMPLVVLEAYRIGTPPGDPQMASEDAVRDFVAAFMDARLAQEGAENHLGTDARIRYEAHQALWHDDQPLYLYGNPHPEGNPAANYAGYRIDAVRSAGDPTCGWFSEAACQDAYEVIVTINLAYLGDAPPGTMQETLIVGPADGGATEFAPWVITAAARGEEPSRS